MFYQHELSFLCEVFLKNRVNALSISAAEIQEGCAKSTLIHGFEQEDFFREVFPLLKERTVHRFTDRFDCRYYFLLLPDTAQPTALCLGPFLDYAVGKKRLSQLAKRNQISPEKTKDLFNYYAGLTVIEENNPLLVMLHSFCERIWRGKAFSFQDVSKKSIAPESPFSRTLANAQPSDTLVSIRAVEQRYSFENDMIRAVTMGQTQMESRFRTAFNEHFLEKRAQNPVRNAKNYAIIMNTLLRKAAERGGVHPLYIDRVSADFAKSIEKILSTHEITSLMCDMFGTYCRLVRSHANDNLPAVVKQAILVIESDLAADLSPSALAKSLCVSLGYLSTAFKKATGKTICEYVREKRMEYAAYLLSSTNQQIQTIAFSCGIMDFQYFSKLFKKQFGKTPTDYRITLKRERKFS